MRSVLLVAAVVAAASFGAQPAQARGDKPWCAVYSTGYDNIVSDCEYDSAEACAPHVIAGNRGFCNQNPAYTPPKHPARGKARRTRRHR